MFPGLSAAWAGAARRGGCLLFEVYSTSYVVNDDKVPKHGRIHEWTLAVEL